MKLKEKICGICAMLSFIGFGACTDETEYSPAQLPNNAQAYFSTSLPSQIDLNSEANSFSVALNRAEAGDEQTIEITASDESGLFEIPSSVTFAEGKDVASITIQYNPSLFKREDYKTVTLSIGENFSTPYASSTYTFQAGIPAPWITLGEATFADSFIFTGKYKVELQQNEEDENRYRLVNPYKEAFEQEGIATKGNADPYLEFTVLPKGSSYNGVTTTTDNLVVYDPVNTGFYNSTYNEDVYLLHPSNVEGNETDESKWNYNIVKSLSGEGKPEIVSLAPVYICLNSSMGNDQSQQEGSISIAFPGIELNDYSVEIVYQEYRMDKNQQSYAVAEVTLGSDVDVAKLAVVSGQDVDAAAEGIENGTINSVEIEESGTVELPFAGQGELSIVAVVYAEDRIVQGSYSTSFEVVGGTAAIDKYLGEWKVGGTRPDAPPIPGIGVFTSTITLSKISDTELLVSGLTGEASYDDRFKLSYDEQNDQLTFYPQGLAIHGDDYNTAMILPANSSTKDTSDEDELIATLEDDELHFTNIEGNVQNWDKIAFVDEIYSNGVFEFKINSFHDLIWKRNDVSRSSHNILNSKCFTTLTISLFKECKKEKR